MGHVLNIFSGGEHFPKRRRAACGVSAAALWAWPEPYWSTHCSAATLPNAGQDRPARGHLLGPVGGRVGGWSENGQVTAAAKVTGAGPRERSQTSESEPLPNAAPRERALGPRGAGGPAARHGGGLSSRTRRFFWLWGGRRNRAHAGLSTVGGCQASWQTPPLRARGPGSGAPPAGAVGGPGFAIAR